MKKFMIFVVLMIMALSATGCGLLPEGSFRQIGSNSSEFIELKDLTPILEAYCEANKLELDSDSDITYYANSKTAKFTGKDVNTGIKYEQEIDVDKVKKDLRYMSLSNDNN